MSVVTVGDFMTRNPITVESSQPVPEARRIMSDKNIRHLPVVNHGKLVGVLSDRDLQFIATLHTLDLETALVEDAMNHDPASVTPDTPLSAVARQMADAKLGSIIVSEGGRVVGVFTTVDALRALAAVTSA